MKIAAEEKYLFIVCHAVWRLELPLMAGNSETMRFEKRLEKQICWDSVSILLLLLAAVVTSSSVFGSDFCDDRIISSFGIPFSLVRGR